VNIVVANTVGRLADGRHVLSYPSRWSWTGAYKPNCFYAQFLGYAAALLKRELPDARVIMVDGNYEQLGPIEYAERLAALEPDVLITEQDAVTYDAMTSTMLMTKARRPAMRAYLCGAAASAFWERALGAQGWDVAVKGEYEYAILDDLRAGRRDYGYVLHGTAADPDALPLPEDGDVSRINYADGGNPLPGMVQVYATRGCPLSCAFCAVPMYYGGHGKAHKSHRTRDVESVCDELAYLAMKYAGRYTGAYFHDETHNADPDWLATFAEAIIRRGLDRYAYDAMCGYWRFTSEDLIALLARAGYRQIRVGIETLDDDTGKAIGKRVIPDRLRQVLAWCKAHGIATYGTTQVGAVSSTEAGDRATLATLVDLRAAGLLDTVQHTVSIPIPGTPFFEECKRNGWLLHEDYTRYSGTECVVDRPEYPAARVNAMFREYYAVRGGGHRLFNRGNA